jgi:hypothetical protein
MYEELINKKIKCVWNDDNTSKAVYGIVKKTDDLFLTLLTDKDNSNLHISFKNIISMKEVD